LLVKDLESAQSLLLAPQMSPLEVERREIVAKVLGSFSEPEQEAIRYVLQHGSVHYMTLSDKFGPFAGPDAVSKACIGGVLAASHSEYCVVNPVFHDALMDYFSKHRPVTPSSD